MRRALVPGTFDPITNGHLDVITRSSKIFDEIIVAVAKSEAKNTLFTLDERVDLARRATEGLDNVKVVGFNELLTSLAERLEVHALVKGLRAITDFEYEFQMAALNSSLKREVETFFIMSPPEYMYLSSSIVRELASLGGDVSSFVPSCVKPAFEAKFAENAKSGR